MFRFDKRNRDGERECRGMLFDKPYTGDSKAAKKMDYRHPRACTFVWPAADDHLYGIEDDE